jgi:hypothetical protein
MDFFERFKVAVADSQPVEPGETFDAYIARMQRLPIGARAMLAATMASIGGEMRREHFQRKRAWIAAARLSFDPGRREACFVCGKFRSVAQAHHVVPLAEQYDRGINDPDQEHAWLCPSHHAILHLWIDDNISHIGRGRRAAPTMDDLSNDEIDRMLDLVKRAGR